MLRNKLGGNRLLEVDGLIRSGIGLSFHVRCGIFVGHKNASLCQRAVLVIVGHKRTSAVAVILDVVVYMYSPA